MTGVEGWAVRTLLAGGGVLLAGFLLVRLARDPGRRQAVGAWAVRGAVLAAVAAAFPAWLPLAWPAAPPPAVVDLPPAAAEVWDGDDGFEAAAGATADPLPEPAPAPAVPPERWLLVGYLAVGGLLFAHLLAGQLGLVRLTRRAAPAPPRVAGRYPGRVFVADGLASPVCFGLVRPTVLLPRGLAEGAGGRELGWVLAHEADHVARGDHRTAWWAGLARCAFFPLPWFWAVRRELRVAQEQLADAAAAGDDPAGYAAFLVSLSAPPARLPPLAAGVRAGRSDLYRRVTMLMSDRAVRPASRRWRLLTAAGAVAGAVVLAGATLATADEPKPQAIEVEVRLDDDQPKADKPTDEKRRVEGRVKANEDVAKLKDKIKEAAKKGDADAVGKLVDELEKALRSAPRLIDLRGQDGRPGLFWEGVPKFDFDFNRAGLGEAIKQLEAQLDRLDEGSPQWKAAEMALDALRKQADGPRWRSAEPRGADPFAGKGRLGIVVGEVPAEVREQLDLADKVGVVVAEVQEGTAAAKAGLRKGDIVAKFGDADVTADPTKFVEVVRATKPGKVDVVVVRKGKKQTVAVDLPEAPKPRADAEALRRKADEARRAADQARRQADQARREAERTDRNGGADFRKLKLQIGDTEFKAEGTVGLVRYTVEGKMQDGNPVVEKVEVQDGNDLISGKSVAEMPEQYRGKLNRLLSMVGNR